MLQDGLDVALHVGGIPVYTSRDYGPLCVRGGRFKKQRIRIQACIRTLKSLSLNSAHI